jgi:hypothetical protein
MALVIRTIGIARATVKIGLANIVYNMHRMVWHSLGLDLETHLPGPAGRPFPLVDFGTKPVMELF